MVPAAVDRKEGVVFQDEGTILAQVKIPNLMKDACLMGNWESISECI